MHDIHDAANAIDEEAGLSNDVLGKECIGCQRLLIYSFFERDSSYRDGRKDLCVSCASSPRLSTMEHICRLRELNASSHAIKRQRWQHQEDYRNDEARVGRLLHHSDFLYKLKKLVPSLFITEGRVIGDWAIFQTYPGPQSKLDGREWEYLFYCHMGYIPEFSIYEFNERDIPQRESRRGWRTVLLRLIKKGLLTEETCNKVFGKAEGVASVVWQRSLYNHRNQVNT